jgi:hypothetical protein
VSEDPGAGNRWIVVGYDGLEAAAPALGRAAEVAG